MIFEQLETSKVGNFTCNLMIKCWTELNDYDKEFVIIFMVLGRRINTRKNIYIFGDLMIFRSLPRTVQRVRRLYCIYWIWRLKFMIDFWSNIGIYIWHFYPTVILYGYQRDSHDVEHSCFKIILALCLIFLTVKRQCGSLKNSFFV